MAPMKNTTLLIWYSILVECMACWAQPEITGNPVERLEHAEKFFSATGAKIHHDSQNKSNSKESLRGESPQKHGVKTKKHKTCKIAGYHIR